MKKMDDFRAIAQEKVGKRWIEKPKDWIEAGSNYEILQEQSKLYIEALKNQLPELRQEAKARLKQIIEELKGCLTALERFDCEYFVKGKERKISGIGLVGRAVLMMFALSRLEETIGILEQTAESLEG